MEVFLRVGASCLVVRGEGLGGCLGEADVLRLGVVTVLRVTRVLCLDQVVSVLGFIELQLWGF